MTDDSNMWVIIGAAFILIAGWCVAGEAVLRAWGM